MFILLLLWSSAWPGTVQSSKLILTLDQLIQSKVSLASVFLQNISTTKKSFFFMRNIQILPDSHNVGLIYMTVTLTQLNLLIFYSRSRLPRNFPRNIFYPLTYRVSWKPGSGNKYRRSKIEDWRSTNENRGKGKSKI